MGYPMAVNLCSKLDKDKVMVICDVDKGALQKFEAEASAGQRRVIIAKSAAEAIGMAVSVFSVRPKLLFT